MTFLRDRKGEVRQNAMFLLELDAEDRKMMKERSDEIVFDFFYSWKHGFDVLGEGNLLMRDLVGKYLGTWKLLGF